MREEKIGVFGKL